MSDGKLTHRRSQTGGVYATLDAAIIAVSLLDVTGSGLILAFHSVPQTQLPIFVGLVTGPLCGALGAYVGARWNNKKADDAAIDAPVK